MNAHQTTKLNMYNAVIKQLSAESAALATIPALQRSFALFVSKVAAIKSLIPRQSEDSTGATITKEGAKNTLVELLADLCSLIYAWAHEAENATGRQKANFNISDWARMKESILPNEAEALYDYAVENKAALADAGVTGDMLEETAQAIDDFSEAAALPRNKISARKTEGKNLAALFDEAEDLLNERVKNLMAGLKKNYPDVYTTFLSNSQMVGNPSQPARQKAAKKKKEEAKGKETESTVQP